MPRKLKRSTTTWRNLVEALTIESVARMRLDYLAMRAAADGDARSAQVLSEAAMAHSRGALEILELLHETGDGSSDAAFGATKANLESEVRTDTFRSIQRYPSFARQAREEGYDEAAEWFEMLARLERSRAAELKRAVDALEGA